MGLFDYLKRKNKSGQQLTPVQIDDNGNIDYEQSLALENQTKPLTLADRLIGRTLTKDVDTQVVNPETGKTSLDTKRITNYRPGFFQDFNAGYNENRYTPISLDNFGQNKGFARRFGEGIGTLTKIAESPLGRSLIVGGLVGATGGNPLEMLAYGGKAGVLNQQNRNNDKIYRADLINNAKQQLINSPEFNQLSEVEKAQILTNLQNDANYNALTDEEKAEALKKNNNVTLTDAQLNDLLKNKQANLLSDAENQYLYDRQQNALSDVENQIDGLRGYVTNDTYNNLIRSQQIRDNYAYRNMMLNNQLEQNRIMNGLRQDQFKSQEEQRKFNNYIAQANLAEKQADRAANSAYRNAQLGVDYARLNLDRWKAEHPNMSAADRKAAEKEKQSMSTISMINQAKNAVANNPNAFKWSTGILGADVANRLDPKGVQARSVVNSVTAEYRKYLTGAQMSDKERKEYEKFLPAPTDNARIINDKLNGMLTVIGAREGLNSSTVTGTQTVGKYKVRVK